MSLAQTARRPVGAVIEVDLEQPLGCSTMGKPAHSAHRRPDPRADVHRKLRRLQRLLESGVDAEPLDAFYALQSAIFEAEAADVATNADEDEHSQGSTVHASCKDKLSPQFLPNHIVHQWLDSSGCVPRMVDASVQVEDDFDDVDFWSAPRIEEDVDSDSDSVGGNDEASALGSNADTFDAGPSASAPSVDGPHTPPMSPWQPQETPSHGDADSNAAGRFDSVDRVQRGSFAIRDDDYWRSVASPDPSMSGAEQPDKAMDVTTVDSQRIRVESARMCTHPKSKKSLHFAPVPSPRGLPAPSARGPPIHSPRHWIASDSHSPSASSGFWKVAESSVSKINELEDTMAKQRGQISLLFSACLKLKGLIERNLPAMLKANVTETIYKESDDASVQAWSAEPLDTEERSSDQAEGLSSSSSVASSASEQSLEHAVGSGGVSDRAIEAVVAKTQSMVSQLAQARLWRQTKVEGDEVYRELWSY